MYSNNLSTIATISLSIMSELFTTCFSCRNNFSRLRNSLGSDGKKILFEIPEAEFIKLADLIILVSVLSQQDHLLSGAFTSKYFFFAKSYNHFLSDRLPRSTL